MEIMHMPADSAWDLGTVLLFIERELQWYRDILLSIFCLFLSPL